MKFGEMRKVTLLDYPDKAACTVFTAGCNFRCPFCQNVSLLEQSSSEQVYDSSDVLEFLQTRKGLLDGVCISGGEPLINETLEAFIKEVKALGFLVKLDTNGSNPEILERLISNELLDYVAMDVKNSKEKYAKTIGLPEYDVSKNYDVSKIDESIKLLLSGKIQYEFRTTLVREFHTAEDLTALTNWIKGAENYFLQKFIASEGVLQSGLNGFSDEEMIAMLKTAKKAVPTAKLRGM